MRKFLNNLFNKKEENSSLSSMKTVQVGVLQPFNEVADKIDIQLKESYKRRY